MASVRELRDRIRSLKSTQQITKAMKQVAGARIRRAQQRLVQSRPYAEAIGSITRSLMDMSARLDHPLMKAGHSGAPAGILLVTADKGLAGAFNSNLIRSAELLRRSQPNVLWYTIGNKARQAVKRFRGEIVTDWSFAEMQHNDLARVCAQQISADFTDGRIASLTIISSKLVSMMTQTPQQRQLLPITVQHDGKPHSGPRADVEFEPSAESVLIGLLPRYLEFTLFEALLETDAAFFAAQLIAMNNATDNAKKLIDQLTIVMNNARQAAITTEILEIVGGAEALTT